MPYMTIEVPAERVAGDESLGIYHSYKYDQVDEGPSTYWFVLDPYQGQDEAFDVRNLPNWRPDPSGTGFLDHYNWIAGILTDAIALGLFEPDKYREWSERF